MINLQKLTGNSVFHVQGHLNYFHGIFDKFGTTVQQNCKEPEALSVCHFFKMLDHCKMS